MIVWQDGNFQVVKLLETKDKQIFLAVNTDKPFEKGHTHLRSKKRAIDLVKMVQNYRIPHHYSRYCLQSLQRLATDETYISKIQEILDTRKAKGEKPTCIRPIGR